MNKRLKMIERLTSTRFKPVWRLAESRYAEARAQAREVCNSIRRDMGVPAYSESKFDEGWQFRNIFHTEWLAAKDEFVNLVFGWW